MSDDILKPLVIVSVATVLLLYWEWRGRTPQANKRYFFIACGGIIVAILGWLGLSLLTSPLSKYLAFVSIAGFIVMIIFSWKYRKSLK